MAWQPLLGVIAGTSRSTIEELCFRRRRHGYPGPVQAVLECVHYGLDHLHPGVLLALGGDDVPASREWSVLDSISSTACT